MIHHVGYEVQSLTLSGAFYDAVFFALGGRRLYESGESIGWGVDEPLFWVTARAVPKPGYGHVAFRASGRAAVDGAYEAGLANGGSDDGPPGDRPQYGPTYYAAYLRDPDGLKVEIVAGA
ncbi:MAG TPA: VOC family protein [Thermoleophilaceae bacterium]|nr:VOC family protein [Thermoleophilaceae bacterium]